MANIVESKTTQNQVAGGAATAGSAYTLVQVLRGWFPNMPGDGETDLSIAMLITVFAGPWLSRTFAFWRAPEKRS